MKKLIILGALLFPTYAFAQASPQASQAPPAASVKSYLDQVVEEWTASNLAQRHLADKLAILGQDWEQKGRQLDAAQQRVRNFEAYAKACGDKPGCFSPVAE